MVKDWQGMQKEVEDLLEAAEKEQQQAKLMKRKSMIPIWRCAVCGRDDKPYIACWVSPYIVRYEERDEL
jgi:rubrerythrin